MDGDLSLSQSLGGLRIANPDDASVSSLPEHSTPRDAIRLPFSVSMPAQISESPNSKIQVPPMPAENSGRPLSQLDFDPASFSIASIQIDNQPIPTTNPSTQQKKQPSTSVRKDNRQSNIPATYQAQQKAQFPQYPVMMPQHQRQYNMSSRPTSMHPQQPMGGPVPSREPSYRLHKESSRGSSGGLGRTTSRGAGAAMQAGVPTREDSHNERSYRNGHPHGNGPLPLRKSSRGIVGGPATNGTGPRNGLPLGSPYGIEGGIAASSEDWQERGAAIATRQDFDANGRAVIRQTKKGVKDFHFGRTLGEGSYSTVMYATDNQTGKAYAIKVLDKRHIIKEKKVKYVNIEKDTLNRLTEHPGVVRLYYTFQDERSLYFVLDIASGGELLGVLKRLTTFNEECTRFYGAQILDTVDYMHSRGVIHRDLKPENVLMDDQMHVKITDFGTAKILDASRRPRAGSNGVPIPGDSLDESDDNRAISFVGTAEYVSPELLTEKNACKASDLWAFGCIIYQLLAGRPPFKAANEYLTFQKIVVLDYTFPQGFPPVARDLVERLLVLDPNRRLTIEHIKNHEFFDGIVWGRSLWRQKAPKLQSYIPPAAAPIKLGGGANGISNGNVNGNGNTNGNSFPPDIPPPHTTKPVRFPGESVNTGQARPSPRVITELPPPSQLDIEWSPVLTRNNERILKLGNLLVLATSSSSSPPSKNEKNGDGSKFSRFFGGGGTTKKNQRLVMVTSSARVIVAAAGGNEKKSKFEIALLSAGCAWKKVQDPKGLSHFSIDTREKHYTFEDPKAASSDGSATSAAAQEWIDAIERAREIAFSQNAQNSYSGDDALRDLQSGGPSPASTLDLGAERLKDSNPAMASRHTLQKYPSTTNPEEIKGFKRFSKRQSKQGLAAVF